MRSWPMLMQRGSTWYFRRTVPLALRPLMEGKREIWRSLRTSDFNEAKLLSLREGQEVERLFQSLREQGERAQVDPDSFARQYESRTRSAEVQWRLHRDITLRARTTAPSSPPVVRMRPWTLNSTHSQAPLRITAHHCVSKTRRS